MHEQPSALNEKARKSAEELDQTLDPDLDPVITLTAGNDNRKVLKRS